VIEMSENKSKVYVANLTMEVTILW